MTDRTTMVIKCRFKDPDCDKAVYTCHDCQVILDFLKGVEECAPDIRDITWLGAAVDLLRQVVNTNTRKLETP